MSTGPKFFQTRMGQRFYEVDVPAAVKALNRLADAVAQRQSVQAPVVSPKEAGQPLSDVFSEEAERLRKLGDEEWDRGNKKMAEAYHEQARRVRVQPRPEDARDRQIERLTAALRLVVAIADYPQKNPGETVILAPKTREQIAKALSNRKTAAEEFSDVEEGDF